MYIYIYIYICACIYTVQHLLDMHVFMIGPLPLFIICELIVLGQGFAGFLPFFICCLGRTYFHQLIEAICIHIHTYMYNTRWQLVPYG